MHTEQLIIVGAGGHSKVVIDTLSALEHRYSITICDDNPDLMGRYILGVKIVSSTASLSGYEGLLHIAIGNNNIRSKILKSLSSRAHLFTVAHPKATISSNAEIGAGSFIAANAVLGPECIIGPGCIINHGAVVDHDVKIGSSAHIAPNSTLGGNVNIGDSVLVGAGAVVLPGLTVGNGAIVAAGAVVTRNVDAYTLVRGVPAV